ncbi:retrovirus-related Pol polyprotein from transposon 412 [Trichonephila clavipes]|nr:retrovirus-related Pol polyprotein from transposon 412 [Trichonephila clavipes]
MDYFTKWPEVYPIPRPKTPTIVEILVQHTGSHDSSPSTTALPIKGRNFDSAVFKRLSAVHETTGYSPSQMLFGHDLRLPVDLLFSQPPDAPLAPFRYIEKLRHKWKMHHLARK